MRCCRSPTACSSSTSASKLAEGEPQAVMDDAEVRRVYMGMEA